MLERAEQIRFTTVGEREVAIAPICLAAIQNAHAVHAASSSSGKLAFVPARATVVDIRAQRRGASIAGIARAIGPTRLAIQLTHSVDAGALALG